MNEIIGENNVNGQLTIIINQLSPAEQETILHYYGINGYERLTLAEIGVKQDRTPATIRQIKNRALRKLTRTIRSTDIKGIQ